MSDKHDALRLADVLDRSVLAVCADAAAELRRLHAVNEALRATFAQRKAQRVAREVRAPVLHSTGVIEINEFAPIPSAAPQQGEK